MSLEFKPDALKDFSDWKTSNNQEGLQGRLEGRIFDEPVSKSNKREGDLFIDTDLKFEDSSMDDSSMTSDLFTEKMELNVTEHFEGQEALDWLKENHPRNIRQY